MNSCVRTSEQRKLFWHIFFTSSMRQTKCFGQVLAHWKSLQSTKNYVQTKMTLILALWFLTSSLILLFWKRQSSRSAEAQKMFASTEQLQNQRFSFLMITKNRSVLLKNCTKLVLMRAFLVNMAAKLKPNCAQSKRLEQCGDLLPGQSQAWPSIR